MPLDPRINMMAQPVQLQDPLAQYAKMAGVQNAMQKNKLMELQMQQVQEAMKNAPQKNQLEMLLKMFQMKNQEAQMNERNAKTGQINNQQNALAQYSELMQTGGVPRNDPFGQPSGVATNEQDGLRMMQEAMARGDPNPRIGVPNQGTLQSLLTQINPQAGVREQMRSMNPTAKAGSSTTLNKLIAERDALPPNDPRRQLYDKAIEKQSTSQPAVNVYSGSMVAGEDASGRPIFAQPSGRPDTPPRVVEGIYPPKKPTDAKAAAKEAEDAATADSVRERIQTMTNSLQSESALVGPAGVVRRGVETVSGAFAPGMKTPAIDYKNDLNLLLADVRKIVEKDANLSNQERTTLQETLGGGITQTPGSALKTLNNVLQYVEKKKLTGPSRAAQQERRAPPVGTVQSGYRFKGGNPAEQSNWERAE